eukprot:scaffold1485_cov171-Amphora_coffeaeformis.AAC.4
MSCSSSPKKKNDENIANDWGWRDDEDETRTEPSKPKSRGLDASRFHQKDKSKPGQTAVEELKMTIQQQCIMERKRQVIQEQELRRSAFRSVTEMKTWHTQQQALEHFAKLKREFLGHDKEENDGNPQENIDKNQPEDRMLRSVGSQDSEYSSSSCSSAQTTSTEGSIAQQLEAKRQLTDRTRSPAKSTRKQQYYQEFIKERNQPPPLPLDLSCGNALWSMEPRIWSIEKSATGKRKYIVGHTGRLLDRYWRRVDRDTRHYYELIVAGQACRLYLDLEFSKLTNPDIDCAESLLTELWQDLSEELRREFPEQITRPLARRDVVDLDATTDQKFSRHWIVHLPGGYLFRDTATMGRFVQNWIGRLATDHATRQLGVTHPLLQKHLFVNPPPSKASSPAAAAIADARPSCILDLGVYTRNRLFRLMGSSKFGKSQDATLRIADANEFPLVAEGDFGNHSFYAPAMLATQLSSGEHAEKSEDDKTLDIPVASPGKAFEVAVESAVKGFEASTDWTLHAEALANTLVVPLNVTKMGFPVLPYAEEDDISAANIASVVGKQSRSVGTRPVHTTFTGPSPYPVIDDFVRKTLATREGTQGSIRAWSVETHDEATHPTSITYQMCGNRWCESIQRAHKSNNIYWVVDLVMWQCVQRCHDPDCRALSFRGTPVPLPDEVREAVQQEWLDEELAKLDEAELLATSKLPSTKARTPAKANQSIVDEFDGDAEFEAALMALNLGTPSSTKLT